MTQPEMGIPQTRLKFGTAVVGSLGRSLNCYSRANEQFNYIPPVTKGGEIVASYPISWP